MNHLIRLTTWALTESARADGAHAATIRITMVALCAVLAATLALAAFGCLVTALWILALPILGPVGTPLAVAAGLSCATIVLSIAGWLVARRRRQRLTLAVAPEFLLSEATRLFSEHKGAVLLAALMAGMLAANGSRKL